MSRTTRLAGGPPPALGRDPIDGPARRARAGEAQAALLARLGIERVRLAAIMAGGAVGTLARAGLAEALPHRPGTWPWATFAVNLAGAFLLGWLLTRLAERTAPSRYWRFLLGTGFCGALTTFSTLQLETFELARDGHAALAIGYPLASLALGMAVAVAGVMAARWRRHW